MIVPQPTAFLLHKFAVLAFVSVLLPAAFAQSINVDDVRASILQQQNPTALTSSGDVAPLEGRIDPNAYLVGPGDGFDLSIGGRNSQSRRIRVSADGRLVIPDVGSFDVADRTLRSVQNEVRSSIRQHYRYVDSDIVLGDPRQFYVHVSGAVIIPGRHVMTPIARVDDALVAAMAGASPQQFRGLTPSRKMLLARAQGDFETTTLSELGQLTPTRLLTPHSDYIPAFRNVLVTHLDGTVDRVDMLRYYATGSIDSNPYLRDGDAVSLQFFDPTQSSVRVSGAVAEPGAYDYRPDDTALALLLIAYGPDAEAQIEEVRLMRSSGRTPQVLTLRASELATTPLEPGDQLYVLPRNANVGTVGVVGATYFPTSYPIRIGETTLRDLVDMAGGFLPDALIRGAYLEREPTMMDEESATENRDLALEPTLRIDVQESAIADAAFNLTRLSTLSYVEKRYLTREFLSKQRLSIDFESALREGAPPIYLRDGDRVVVPFDLGSVYVFGQVFRPGHVPFVEGRTFEDYIAYAGGRSQGATDSYVLVASGGLIPADQAATISSGDLVFVNRQFIAEDRFTQQAVIQERSMDLQESRAESDSTFRIISTALAAISTVVTVVLLFQK